ncbi:MULTISPECIES: NUDIX domain-containing protein [unclassified Streptomyces]|uniref:NUDIX domain-containing protein n=1 Tax=unclassified Streptomyces TaxID=2593676 RepID=UPI00278C8ACE|nr:MULTISPECIES: NUDIX domain-containing protein [unclassified Streptomyces]
MERQRVRELRRRIGYPDVPVPAVRDWFTLGAGYAPVEYEAPSVPEPERDLAAVWRRAARLTCHPLLLRDGVSGRPLSPAGPTGITGRGRLHRLGPNPTADAVLTQGTNAEVRVLLVRRRDTGQLAFPGGFRETDPVTGAVEDPVRAALREAAEETGVRVRGGAVRLLHQGVAHWSVRNTDNAWIENTAIHVRLPPAPGGPPPVEGRDDALSAGWFPVRDVETESLSAAHAATLRRLRRALDG